jgi:hypothetical protein
VLARQALKSCFQPFLLWLFWRWGSLAFCPGGPGQQSYFVLSTIAGMTGACHHTQIFPRRYGLTNFFAQAGLEL